MIIPATAAALPVLPPSRPSAGPVSMRINLLPMTFGPVPWWVGGLLIALLPVWGPLAVWNSRPSPAPQADRR